MENSKEKNELEIKKKIQKEKTFNGLDAQEWAKNSRSVWNDLSSIRQKKHLIHGATYPEKLCDRIIKIYSKKGDLIFDPFLGTGTTVIAALKNKRGAIGIELTDKYFNISNKSIFEILSYNKNLNFPKLIQGDALQYTKELEDNSIQLTLTSPPYADLIHKVVEDREKRHKNSAFVIKNKATTNLYSNDELDLGNMPIVEYINAVDSLMKDIYIKTKPGGYNIWVVKDFRDTKNKIPYFDLHTIIANSGKSAGFLYQDLIIWDQNQHRKLVLLGYPSVFYVNQNHSFIVVLRKPK